MRERTELEIARDYFVRGEYYFSRLPVSQIHDYDSIKHLAFGTNVDGRTDEFVVYDSNPVQVMDMISKLNIDKDYWITEFSEEEPQDYAAEGYSIKSTEFLMMKDLNNLSIETDNKLIKRVETSEEAQHINHMFNRVVINLEKFEDPNLRFYVGEENGQPVSYGAYAQIDDTVFLSNVFTSPIHRGKGLAQSLCRTMLMDAKQEGMVQSVLISSQMGHPLYKKLGYREVSKMWVFERKS